MDTNSQHRYKDLYFYIYIYIFYFSSVKLFGFFTTSLLGCLNSWHKRQIALDISWLFVENSTTSPVSWEGGEGAEAVHNKPTAVPPKDSGEVVVAPSHGMAIFGAGQRGQTQPTGALSNFFLSSSCEEIYRRVIL